ncbi:MAG: iron chelate uptake ABC transporter family permease subunit [Firmicutes bacterium]|nr:iron chelate uptake ABC transporter family permease subunit [Bacillota bacterium]
MGNRRKIVLLSVVALVLVILYLTIGLNSRNWEYALSRRIPNTIAIIATGAAIAFATTVFQTVTNNRVLTPGVMGLDSLYLVIQTAIVFAFGSTSLVVVNRQLNFLLAVGGMVVFALLLYNLLFKRESTDIYFVLLVGLIVGTLFQSGASFMQMVIDPNEFLVLQNRMFASFNNVNTDILLIALVAMGVVLLYSRRYFAVLDVLALGRDQAINLGVEYEGIVRRMLIVVAVLMAVSTGLVGPITFLGLLVTNLAREFLSTYEHKYLVLGSVLVAVIALVGGQLLAERVFNFVTPISVLINLAGGLYFIYLLLKEHQL